MHTTGLSFTVYPQCIQRMRTGHADRRSDRYRPPMLHHRRPKSHMRVFDSSDVVRGGRGRCVPIVWSILAVNTAPAWSHGNAFVWTDGWDCSAINSSAGRIILVTVSLLIIIFFIRRRTQRYLSVMQYSKNGSLKR